MSHTPGPWKWWTSNSVMRLSAEGDGDVLHAFKATDGFPCISVNNANARLIAAAPSMLKALKSATENGMWVGDDWIVSAEALREIEAAIAKAEMTE